MNVSNESARTNCVCVSECACTPEHTYETVSLPGMLLYFKSCGCNMRHPLRHLPQPMGAGVAACINALSASSSGEEAGLRESFSLTL